MGFNENDSTSETVGRRLGRLPMKTTRKALLFSDFFKFVKLPKKQEYWVKKPPLPLRSFGNLKYGDCTRAKQAVAAMRMERLEQRKTIEITDAEVIRVYQEMSDRLYGGGDNGAYEDDALNEWRNPEKTFRDTEGHPYTIDAYLRINAANHDEMRAALALAGAKGIAICLNLPAAYSRVDPPATWDVPKDQRLIGDWLPGSWGGHCAAGDTPIPLLSGETVPIQDLVGQRDLWVYGALPTSQPVPAMARTVVRTRRAKTIRVTHDYGGSIRTTPEHLFMLRDGTYRRADALQPGDRLMPLRRLTHYRGYEKVKWYDGAKCQAFTHRLVAQMLGADSSTIVTHHIDGNKKNNHPSNLGLGSQAEHVRIHRPWELSPLTNAPGWFATPEGREYSRSRFLTREREAGGQFVPDSENHKVLAVEHCAEEWVYDLIDVNPTGNFAAGSVFIHNSMNAYGFNATGMHLDCTWELPPNVLTWDAAAAYCDEAHLYVDSLDAWRKKATDRKVKSALGDVADAVNAISAIKVEL